MLVRCLYASRSTTPISSHIAKAILAQSRKNNPRLGITGLLCCTSDTFIQVLEGGRDQVSALFNAIVRDDRHIDLQILLYEEIAERRFGNWTMGEVNIQGTNQALLLKYSEKAELNPFACSGRSTMALLDELVATGSIGCRVN